MSGFFHLARVACISTSLLFIAEQYCTVWKRHIFACPFISSWTFGLFPRFAHCENVAVNISVQFGEDVCSLLLGVYLGVELLGHVVRQRLTFGGTAKLCSQPLHHFTFPPTMDEGCSLSTCSPTLVTFCLFDYSHPEGAKWYLIVVSAWLPHPSVGPF